MNNWIRNAIASIKSYLSTFEIKRIFAPILASLLFLAATPDNTKLDANAIKMNSNPELRERIGNVLEQDDPERPTTTRQWEQEARETKGDPNERVKRIGEEAKDAVKDWGKLYPNTVKRSANSFKEELENNDMQ
jgi:hypothetical protein